MYIRMTFFLPLGAKSYGYESPLRKSALFHKKYKRRIWKFSEAYGDLKVDRRDYSRYWTKPGLFVYTDYVTLRKIYNRFDE